MLYRVNPNKISYFELDEYERQPDKAEPHLQETTEDPKSEKDMRQDGARKGSRPNVYKSMESHIPHQNEQVS